MLLVSMQQILRICHLSLELVEVVTRAVDWPAEKEDVLKKKKKKIWTDFSCTTSTPGAAVFFFLISTPTCRDRRRNRFSIEFIEHKCNEVNRYGTKEVGTGEHLTL